MGEFPEELKKKIGKYLEILVEVMVKSTQNPGGQKINPQVFWTKINLRKS